MKKKISLLLLVFVLALSFAGCGSQKTTISYDQSTLENSAEMIVQSFAQMGDSDFALLQEESEFSSNYRLLQSSLPIDHADFIAMMDAWQKATTDYGAYIEHGDYEVEATDKDVTLTTKAVFENNNDTELSFVFDEKLNMTSMTVDIHYTMGQILEKAGLNTLLGMGTVFCVLIFISLIISLFKFIPAIEAKFTKKGKAQAEAPKVPAAEAPKAVVKTAGTDDAQLVAVITAAIAAAEGTGNTDGFIVRSIKRRKTNKWN